jgi:hypothetical protein
MHQPVNRRCGRPRVLEYVLPFREGPTARDHHTPAFVPFCQERQSRLPLFVALVPFCSRLVCTGEYKSCDSVNVHDLVEVEQQPQRHVE